MMLRKRIVGRQRDRKQEVLQSKRQRLGSMDRFAEGRSENNLEPADDVGPRLNGQLRFKSEVG